MNSEIRGQSGQSPSHASTISWLRIHCNEYSRISKTGQYIECDHSDRSVIDLECNSAQQTIEELPYTGLVLQ